MVIFGLKNCDSCRKAQKALAAAGHAPRLVDIRDTPPARATLERFAARFGAAIVNTRSTTWRGLDENARGHAPVDLILAHPALMKRPVIEADDGTLYLGWGAEVQAALS